MKIPLTSEICDVTFLSVVYVVLGFWSITCQENRIVGGRLLYSLTHR